MRSRRNKRKVKSLFMALLLTTVMLVMSTYAWFSANRVVEITGLTAKVSAAEGLQISLDGASWTSSVEVNASTLSAASSYNDYLLPNELKPVSTIGVVSGDEIQFYDGRVSADGSRLDGATSATRSSATTAATGKYIVFDIYLKNSSSQTSDALQLAPNALVRLGTTQDHIGVENTGLENSVRIGFLLFQNTAAFTAAQGDIAGLTSGDFPLVSIWEPNYDQHINEVLTNDSRITDQTLDFRTFGLINAGSGTLTGINGTAATTFMAQTNTIRTAWKVTADTALTSAVAITDSNDVTKPVGTALELKGNQISKVRVYIWLEGQDPDCIDTASTGKYLDFVINLSKPALDGGSGSGSGSGSGGEQGGGSGGEQGGGSGGEQGDGGTGG